MPEFLHELVARREVTSRRSLTDMTSSDFYLRMHSQMTDSYNRLLGEQATLISTDPWAAVEARNADEELHYSGGPY
jgi:hypothetical protein